MVFEIIAGALLLVILLLLVAMAVWVYRNAKQNNVRYAFGWAVLTFFSGLFGILLYLAVEKFHLMDELKQPNGR